MTIDESIISLQDALKATISNLEKGIDDPKYVVVVHDDPLPGDVGALRHAVGPFNSFADAIDEVQKNGGEVTILLKP